MMRKELGALIIASLLIGWGEPARAEAARAQAVRDDGATIRDIVELAGRERARRAAIQAAREDRIYTTSDVEQYMPPTPETAAAPTVSDADAGIEAAMADRPVMADARPVMTPEEAWQAWQDQVVELRNQILILEDRSVDLQLQITEIRGTVTAPRGTLQARNRALADLAVAQGNLDETNAELEAASRALDQLLANEPPRPD